MTRVELMLALARVGILQFGYFTTNYGETAAPVKFNFPLLPSFPTLMLAVAEQFGWHLRERVPETRLLATPNTVALGGVIASQTNIPLLLPRYVPGKASYRIQGTADIDNPLVMLTDVVDDGRAELELHQHSTRIGLPVQQVVAVLDTGRARTAAFTEQLPHVAALYTLTEAVDWIAAEGWIPAGLAAAVSKWQSIS